MPPRQGRSLIAPATPISRRARSPATAGRRAPARRGRASCDVSDGQCQARGGEAGGADGALRGQPAGAPVAPTHVARESRAGTPLRRRQAGRGGRAVKSEGKDVGGGHASRLWSPPKGESSYCGTGRWRGARRRCNAAATKNATVTARVPSSSTGVDTGSNAPKAAYSHSRGNRPTNVAKRYFPR